MVLTTYLLFQFPFYFKSFIRDIIVLISFLIFFCFDFFSGKYWKRNVSSGVRGNSVNIDSGIIHFPSGWDFYRYASLTEDRLYLPYLGKAIITKLNTKSLKRRRVNRKGNVEGVSGIIRDNFY